MALQWVGGGTQYCEFPRDVSIDNLATWTVIAWIYPTNIAPSPNSSDIFNKAHAKRFDLDATTGYLNLKQNKSGGVIETVADVINTANKWYYVAGVIDANAGSPNEQGWLYVGDLTTVVAEVGSYVLRQTAYGGTLEDDTIDPTWNTPGTLIVGNKPWRNPWEGNRGFYGSIATLGFWSTALTLGEIRKQQFSFYPIVQNANCELFVQLGWHGRSVQVDLSGKGRNGRAYGI